MMNNEETALQSIGSCVFWSLVKYQTVFQRVKLCILLQVVLVVSITQGSGSGSDLIRQPPSTSIKVYMIKNINARLKVPVVFNVDYRKKREEGLCSGSLQPTTNALVIMIEH